MIYLVRYEQSIWDVAVNSVGVGNAIEVTKLADSWDDDLSGLWGSEITLPDIVVITRSTIRGADVILPQSFGSWSVRDKQSIYDLAAQLHGSLDNVLKLAMDNNVALDDTLDIGLVVTYYTNDQINSVLADFIKKSAFVFATDVAAESGSFLIDEFGGFIVTEFDEKILV